MSIVALDMRNQRADFVHSIPSSPGLIHICGFPGGGTDLVRNLLRSHPDVEIAGEIPLLPQLADEYGAEVPGERVHELVAALRRCDVYRCFTNLEPDVSTLAKQETVPVAQIYGSMLSPGSRRWKGNKTPQNTENIGRLLGLFPDSKFVLVARDIRDICLSWRSKWGRNMPLCAARWERRMRQGLDSLSNLGDAQGIIVKYEDLLRDPAEVSRRLCRFLEIEFSDNMLHFHEHVDTVNDGKKNFGRPIDAENFGKWRNALSAAKVRRIEEIAYDAMQRLSYVPARAEAQRPVTVLERNMGFLHDASAMMFVGNRYDSKNQYRDRARRIKLMLSQNLRFR